MNREQVLQEIEITMKTEGFHLTLTDNQRIKFFLANPMHRDRIIMDIVTAAKLAGITKEEKEKSIVSLRIAMELCMPFGNDTLQAELLKIHKNLFSDIYHNWAGVIRNVNISKNGMMFCDFKFIEKYLTELCSEIDIEKMKVSTKEKVAEDFGRIISEINAIHPFKDGNGRSIRIWAQKLAALVGYDLLFSLSSPNDILIASVEGMKVNYDYMTAIFDRGLIKL